MTSRKLLILYRHVIVVWNGVQMSKCKTDLWRIFGFYSPTAIDQIRISRRIIRALDSSSGWCKVVQAGSCIIYLSLKSKNSDLKKSYYDIKSNIYSAVSYFDVPGVSSIPIHSVPWWELDQHFIFRQIYCCSWRITWLTVNYFGIICWPPLINLIWKK